MNNTLKQLDLEVTGARRGGPVCGQECDPGTHELGIVPVDRRFSVEHNTTPRYRAGFSPTFNVTSDKPDRPALICGTP
jgi:hypothetical protein